MIPFSQVEEQTLRAVANRIIPADEYPAAWEAGAGEYIKKQMQHDLKEHLRQLQAWLNSLNIESNHVFKKPFCSLSSEDQDQLLQCIEKGTVNTEWAVSCRSIFKKLVEWTAEGFYSDPGNLGNLELVSWRMIGFVPKETKEMSELK